MSARERLEGRSIDALNFVRGQLANNLHLFEIGLVSLPPYLNREVLLVGIENEKAYERRSSNGTYSDREVVSTYNGGESLVKQTTLFDSGIKVDSYFFWAGVDCIEVQMEGDCMREILYRDTATHPLELDVEARKTRSAFVVERDKTTWRRKSAYQRHESIL